MTSKQGVLARTRTYLAIASGAALAAALDPLEGQQIGLFSLISFAILGGFLRAVNIIVDPPETDVRILQIIIKPIKIVSNLIVRLFPFPLRPLRYVGSVAEVGFQLALGLLSVTVANQSVASLTQLNLFILTALTLYFILLFIEVILTKKDFIKKRFLYGIFSRS